MYNEYYEEYPSYTYNGINDSSNLTMYNYSQDNDDRLLGGFGIPFILGGITGGLFSQGFYRPYYRPWFRPNYRPYPPFRPPYGRW